MRRQGILLAAFVCLVAATAFAADAQIGTWKLNESKSKISPGNAKNHTVVYAAAGDKVKVTVDGAFDGKEYPVTGDATSDMRSYTKVDDHTLAMTIKKGGQVTVTGKIVVSADGKTRTVSTSGMDPKGTAFSSTAVYDKQ
jgi:uncharacterized protein (DUF2147 family)